MSIEQEDGTVVYDKLKYDDFPVRLESGDYSCRLYTSEYPIHEWTLTIPTSYSWSGKWTTSVNLDSVFKNVPEIDDIVICAWWDDGGNRTPIKDPAAELYINDYPRDSDDRSRLRDLDLRKGKWLIQFKGAQEDSLIKVEFGSEEGYEPERIRVDAKSIPLFDLGSEDFRRAEHKNIFFVYSRHR
jgi:hypothetical protein